VRRSNFDFIDKSFTLFGHFFTCYILKVQV